MPVSWYRIKSILPQGISGARTTRDDDLSEGAGILPQGISGARTTGAALQRRR